MVESCWSRKLACRGPGHRVEPWLHCFVGPLWFIGRTLTAELFQKFTSHLSNEFEVEGSFLLLVKDYNRTQQSEGRYWKASLKQNSCFLILEQHMLIKKQVMHKVTVSRLCKLVFLLRTAFFAHQPSCTWPYSICSKLARTGQWAKTGNRAPPSSELLSPWSQGCVQGLAAAPRACPSRLPKPCGALEWPHSATCPRTASRYSCLLGSRSGLTKPG